MFWTENNSQILLFEAGVLTIAIPASPDTHATSEIECLKKNPHKNTYHEPQNFLREEKKKLYTKQSYSIPLYCLVLTWTFQKCEFSFFVQN